VIFFGCVAGTVAVMGEGVGSFGQHTGRLVTLRVRYVDIRSLKVYDGRQSVRALLGEGTDMPDEDVARLAELVAPTSPTDFATVLCRWLRDCHHAAERVQHARRDSARGDWRNATSFGVDRYQYLRETAVTLRSEIDLRVSQPSRSLLLLLLNAAVYPLRMADPDGSVGEPGELRAELLGAPEAALFSRNDIRREGKPLLLLPWSGQQTSGLSGAWAGQGKLDGNSIAWQWRLDLLELATGFGGPSTTSPPEPPMPDGADPFDEPLPGLPMPPRPDIAHGTG
jgi:hypothetical protein